MIKSIRHKALKNYWVKGDKRKLPSEMVRKIEMVMNILDNIEKVPDDFSLSRIEAALIKRK